MKNLVIVESPAKAKTIEKFLGPDYKVMSSFGHIRDLKKKGMSVDIEGDFSPQYEIPSDKKELVKNLKRAAADADKVWLASDEDREGEAIAWHLYEVLGLKPENTERIVFHEITKPAILHAIENPRKIDIDRVNAQQARRVLDRIVGFELSPVLWKKIKPSLSAGRVQSVAVRLICEREKEIADFRPEPYFRITATMASPSGLAFKAEYPLQIPSENEAKLMLDKCKGAHFRVQAVTSKPVSRKPAPPFTTSTLQQEAGRKLGFSVNTTMRIAQKLYEEGFITYMRTDSTNLSSLARNDIKRVVTSEFGEKYSVPRNYHTNSKGAQEAHEAIRPTYVDKNLISGTPWEQKLYALIWKRAVASQMADAILEKTNVEISSDATENNFKASGEILKFDGFLKVYGLSDSESATDADRGILPPLKEGDSLDAEKIMATERFSLPPARYSEATLVKKMEDLGIGRPSTYAPTISTIQNREYIRHGDNDGTPREYTVITLENNNITTSKLSEKTGSTRGKLVPTDTGMVVNEFLTMNFPDILDYNFTAKVEEKFDEIAEGSLQWQKEISDFYGDFHPFIDKVNAMRLEHKVGERVLGTDPSTGRRVSVKIGRFGPVVQIGEASEDEKPLFASLTDGQSIQSITLEEALKLFELPRKVGEFEGEDITAAIGRFGPYIRHAGMFVSIPAEMAPQSITKEEAVALIEKKREEEANRLIKTFDELPGVEVLRGRFGPYIAFKKEGMKKAVNYKIPKGRDPEMLSAEEVTKLMESQDASPKKKASTRRTARK
ncbi:MAG: type I DNA topoisomerase [Candidatus Amulumruptor caecigallinarius]|nr:type I DNA topoisomerase [Candidatus Amulumruptor caecigallinarius]